MKLKETIVPKMDCWNLNKKMSFKIILMLNMILVMTNSLSAQDPDEVKYETVIIDDVEVILNKTELYYDEAGNIDHLLVSAADTITGNPGYIPFLKENKTYLVVDGYLTNTLLTDDHSINLNYGNAAVQWIASYQYIATYNASRQLLLEEDYYFNIEDNAWEGNKKLSNTYSAEDIPSAHVIYLWDETNADWQMQNGWKHEYFNETVDGIYYTTFISSLVQDNDWVYREQKIEGYFDEALTSIESVIRQSWDTSLLTWMNESKVKFTYDTNGEITSELSEKGSGSAWLKEKKIVYAYDAAGQLELHKEYRGNHTTDNWELIAKNIYDYTSSSVMSRFYALDESDPGNEGWIGIMKEYTEFDGSGRLTVKEKYGNQSGISSNANSLSDENWKHISKTEYYYETMSGYCGSADYEKIEYGTQYQQSTEGFLIQEQGCFLYADPSDPSIYEADNTVSKMRVKIYKGEESSWKEVL
ncbi:hypothetical protein [Reichenbachiella sp.]|uniref:hypothetical protein n=1 Tax=Reichenbachiella sp. TaxID=2184521 RepID=UPI003297BED7